MMMSEEVDEKKVVCVTGASGYIASWLVKLLLDHRPNYTVKATVRNLNDPRKVEHLKALQGAAPAERLHLFQADLMEDGSFDSAIDGCDCVFHVASPCFISSNDPQRELIEPAVKGTLNVLKSCAKVTSIKRVVLTASIGSVVFNGNPKGPDVLVDETWYSDKAFCEQSQLWYPLSKLLAEEAARNFAEENGIDLVVMNPGLVIGPLLQPTLNFTSEAVILNILTGKEIFPTYQLVDVRDVAYAHILAFENRSAKGRYLLVGSRVTASEIKQILNKLYPSLNLPTDGTENASATLYKVSKEKADSLGISFFMPLEKSLKDTVECFIDKNFFSLP